MIKYAVRSDMEGLTGVVAWEEVIPGGAPYYKAQEWLHAELDALGRGLVAGGAEAVEIYDEHYYGLNVDAFRLPPKMCVVRGKPPYTSEWRGGIDSSFSGLILQGYHAMWGCEGGILPHTYEPDIRAIFINGKLVGEIGVEAAVAGDAGVPLVLIIGDKHGTEEASALIPGVETVVVKEGHGFHQGRCFAWTDLEQEILSKAKHLVKNPPAAKPLRFDGPVTFKVELNEGPYRERFWQDHRDLSEKEGMVSIQADSVTQAWATYWAAKDDVLAKLKAQV